MIQDNQAWQTLEKRNVFSAEPWVSVERQRVGLPSGLVIEDFYRIHLPEFAAIVALDKNGKFVMVRGYKHGAEQLILSPPAGMLSPGESPLHAAQRELEEETGYAGGEWRYLGQFVADGNRKCGVMHLFLARNVAAISEPCEDEGEPLTVELLNREEALACLLQGGMPTLAAAGSLCIALALESL